MMKRARNLMLLTLVANLWLCMPVYASDDIELAGDVIQILLPATAGGLTLYKNDREGLIQFSESFLTTLGATYTLKLTVDKKRPNGGSQSFPSGHTSAAFSGASFLQRRYGWKYGLPAYLSASFVGWSRIESDNHYVEDVLAGAAIGVLSTYLFTDPYPYKNEISVTPLVGQGTWGVLLTTAF
jgi:membrane-associated phospholipid phosphatase